MPRRLRVKFRGRSIQEFAQRYLTDISATGMFVRTSTPLPVGTKIAFDFRLEDETSLMEGEAVVLWKAEENPEIHLPSGMELRFESFAPGSEDRFHWLQMERRGVTVGREMPLSITTSSSTSHPEGVPSAPHPSASNQLSHKHNTSPGRPDTLLETAQPATDHQEDPNVREADDPASAGLSAVPTTPFVRVPQEASPEMAEEPPDQAAALVPYQWDGLTVPRETSHLESEDESRERPSFQSDSQQRPAERSLPPGDSDPGKLFHYMASLPSITSVEVGPLKPQHTILVGERKVLAQRNWKAFIAIALVAAGISGGAVYFLLSKEQHPSTPAVVNRPRVVRVISIPDRSEVFIDNRRAGTTPLELDFTARTKLTLKHPGYVPELVMLEEHDPRWQEKGEHLVLEVRIHLRSIADVKAAAARIREEQGHTVTAEPPGSGAVHTEQPHPVDPSQGRRGESTASKQKKEGPLSEPKAVRPDPQDGDGILPAERSPRSTVPPAETKEPREVTEPTPILQEPHVAEQPAAEEKPPPSKTLKTPTWVGEDGKKDPARDKKKTDDRLKKPSWMENEAGGQGKKPAEEKKQKPAETKKPAPENSAVDKEKKPSAKEKQKPAETKKPAPEKKPSGSLKKPSWTE